MNNELQTDWQSLVADAKGKCGALLFQYDDAIIAADELIKEQQAEIEHYKSQLDRVCEDGNTPADFDKLRDANLALAMESHQQQAHIERLRAGLEELAEQAAQVDGWESFPSAWLDSAYSVLSEQPAQSLEAVKREWHEQLIKESEVIQKEILDKCMSVRSSLDSTEDSPLEKIIKIGETLGVLKGNER